MHTRTILAVLLVLAIVVVIALELYGLNWVSKDPAEDQRHETSVLLMM